MKTFIFNQLSLSSVLRLGGNTACCRIVLLLALLLWPGSAFAQGNSAPLLTTFINPNPGTGAAFGNSVAAVGSDRVLVGAFNAGVDGEAYLFSLHGTLLTTFTQQFSF